LKGKKIVRLEIIKNEITSSYILNEQELETYYRTNMVSYFFLKNEGYDKPLLTVYGIAYHYVDLNFESKKEDRYYLEYQSFRKMYMNYIRNKKIKILRNG